MTIHRPEKSTEKIKELKIDVNNSNFLIKKYCEECAKYPLITKEDEKKLTEKSRAGNKEARQKLINSNLRLVILIAKKYLDSGIELMDLIQEGNIGLINAADKYDPSYNTKFSTYAAYWIKMRIRKAIKEKGNTIKVPIGAIRKFGKLSQAKIDFENKNGREPTDEELQEITSLSIKFIQRTEEAPIPICNTSLDSSNNDDENMNLESLISNTNDNLEENAEKIEKSEKINKILNKLPALERYVLKNYYGIGVNPKTLQEIGNDLNYTKVHIWQVKKRGLLHVQKAIDENSPELKNDIY